MNKTAGGPASGAVRRVSQKRSICPQGEHPWGGCEAKYNVQIGNNAALSAQAGGVQHARCYPQCSTMRAAAPYPRFYYSSPNKHSTN